MPLGAARLTLLAFQPTVAVEAEVIRKKVGVSAIGNAQVDTAQYKFGGASALFDGTGDYLVVGDSDFGNSIPDLNEYTIEFWVRFDRTTNFEYLIGQRDTGLGSAGWAIQYRGDTDDKINLFYAASPGNELETTSTFSSGTWYHIALVKASNNLSVYVNGTQEDSDSEGSYVDSNQPIWIGRRQNGSGDLDGNIDEVRISNTARYTTTFTPSTEPFVNDDNTLLLLHMNGTDGSTFFEDDNGVGRSACGILVGNNAQIDTAQSKFGGSSAIFDGTNDAIRVIPDPNIMSHPYTGAFTMEFWFYMPTNPGATATLPLVNRFGGGFGSREFMVLVENLNIRIAYNAYNGSDPIQNLNMTGSGTFATSTWHHFAWGYDGDKTYSVWLNGTRFNTVTTTYSNHQLTATGFQMGGYGSYTNPGNDWPGSIDEFRISTTDRYGVTNSSITVPTAPFINDADTAMLLHMDGTDGDQDFRDDNGVGRSAVGVSANGNAKISETQSKFGGTSLRVDGTSDWIDTEQSDVFEISGDFTIEFWTRASSNTNEYIIHNRGNGLNSTGQFSIRLYNGSLYLSLYNVSSINGGSFGNYTWRHIAAVRSGSTVTLYVNGVSKGTATWTDTLGATYNSIRIGAFALGTSDYFGDIDEVRVSDTARYTSAFTAPTEPFQNDSNTLLLLHMDGTDGSTTFVDDNGKQA